MNTAATQKHRDPDHSVTRVGSASGGSPLSPTSLALASLNMTRDDLARHTDQMRSFLSTSAAAVAATTPLPAPPSQEHTTPVKTEIDASGRPTMDAVLERSEKRRRDLRSTKKQQTSPPVADTVAATLSTSIAATNLSLPCPPNPPYSLKPPPARDASSRASSVSSSVPIQQQLFSSPTNSSYHALQDVFYPTAPSTSVNHPSLRRSMSTASQTSASCQHPVTIRDAEHDAAVDAILGLDQSPEQQICGVPDNSSNPYMYPPPSYPTANASTPLKPTNQHKTLILPSGASPGKRVQQNQDQDAAAATSLSPVYPFPPSSSPITPYRPHLKPNFASAATGHARPRNAAIPSSSPARQPISSPTSMADMSSPTHPGAVLPFKLPAGPRLTGKPHYSYAALIGQALMSSPTKRLSLNQIYQWISMAYPFFKRGEAGWQNSIRHNLSLNGCFVKIKRDDGEKGKGSWWAIREGDEGCFSGGGFVRQGRANGRKRKGKAEKDADAIGGVDLEEEEAAEDEAAGASPKKKKKMSANPTKAAPTLDLAHRPHNLPSYSRSASASTTATSIFSQATTSSYDSIASYSQGAGGYAIPSSYGTLSGSQSSDGSYAAAQTRPPHMHIATHPSLAQLSSSSGTSFSSHVRSPATKGYQLRLAGTAPGPPMSSSPLATRSIPSSRDASSERGDEEEDEGDEGLGSDEEDGQPQPQRLQNNADADGQDMDRHEPEASPLNTTAEAPSEPVSVSPQPPQGLGLPFFYQPSGSSVTPSTSLASLVASSTTSRTSMASSSASSGISSVGAPEPRQLQPGFTFSAPKASEDISAKMEQSDDNEDDEDKKEQERLSREEEFASFFSSSPIPQSNQRSSSRRSTAAAGTDLLSRVLESKAAKRSTSSHQSSPSSTFPSMHFPRPSTPPPRTGEPPSTPVKGSTKRKTQADTDEDAAAAALLKDMDPTLAAAVTALASLSPVRTPVSHRAFHMSPAPPPVSNLGHYKHSLGPPMASPFRTPGSSHPRSKTNNAPFDYYDYLGGDGTTPMDDMDKAYGVDDGGRSSVSSHLLLGPGGVPRTPATPTTNGMFGSLYQSPSLPSPGWRRY
ncbi:forkhead box C2 (MFH-1, mesenchyme forkhead 1) [Tulasnella sp. 331]|nr:forkhead box C2 (MFH-1, mesenchyme forkhead 1) [Tulasnella sp. 331]